MTKMVSAGRQYVQKLVEQLLDPSESTRKEVIARLSQIDDSEKINILMEFIQHPDSVVRYAVKKALNTIKLKHPELAGNFVATAPLNSEQSDQKTRVYLIVGFCILIILLHNILTLVFFKRNKSEILQEKARSTSVKSFISGDLTGGVDKYNLIRFSDRQPVLKIKGYVSSIDRIRKTAVVVFNSAGDRCVVSFPEGAELKMATGDRIEVEGELVRNDNIGPVQVRAKMVQTAK